MTDIPPPLVNDGTSAGKLWHALKQIADAKQAQAGTAPQYMSRVFNGVNGDFAGGIARIVDLRSLGERTLRDLKEAEPHYATELSTQTNNLLVFLNKDVFATDGTTLRNRCNDSGLLMEIMYAATRLELKEILIDRVDPVEIRSLIDRLNDIIGDVTQSDELPPEAKTALLDLLESAVSALRGALVNGFEGIDRTVRICVGTLWQLQDPLAEPEAAGYLEQFRQIFEDVCLAVKTGKAIKALPFIGAAVQKLGESGGS